MHPDQKRYWLDTDCKSKLKWHQPPKRLFQDCTMYNWKLLTLTMTLLNMYCKWRSMLPQWQMTRFQHRKVYKKKLLIPTTSQLDKWSKFHWK
jgi:hypothetical protein